MAFSMATEIERDLISARTKEAPRARKASGQPLGRPKGPGKSKLDPFRPEIEALQHNARQLLKLDEEERNQETQRIEILWRNRHLCAFRAHEWVPGRYWDLIITLDDATSEHYSMFFVEEEGTASSFRAMAEVITEWGLPSSLYTDRGAHYWHTPEAGGKVDRRNLTQFGRAMRQLGVEMIPAYSPEARGRCERMFGTHQGRLPKELAARSIDTLCGANRYLAEHYRPAFNAEFAVPAAEAGTAFVPFIGPGLADILCEQIGRTVGRDNCVSFENLKLQIPAQAHRRHFTKVRVRVHRYPDGCLAVFHGPRKLADYHSDGSAAGDPAADVVRARAG